MKYIRFNNLLRYQYLKGFVQPFVQGGFSVSYAFRRSESYRSTTPNRAESLFLPVPKPMEYGFVGGVCIQVKRFSMEGRYETAMGIMSNYKNATGTTRSVFLLLGYQIK